MKTRKATIEPTVEEIKASSSGLRGNITEELAEPNPCFGETSAHLLKHHGVYQQDNRDARKSRKELGLAPDYRFMVRTRLPGGRLSPEQYLACSELATRYGSKDLRATSRQNLEFHGIAKGDLAALIRDLNRLAAVTTFASAGDVVRNVTVPPVLDIDPRFGGSASTLLDIAKKIAAWFTPRTHAYYDLWLNGKPVKEAEASQSSSQASNDVDPAEEPLYGAAYLPRKLKIGLATDFDNSVDVFTNDIGIIATTTGMELPCYEIVIGGGLGFSRNVPTTYPCLATPFAFVSADQLLPLVDAVVRVYRDHGSRSDRGRARLRYLLDAWGLERFREVVFEYAGRAFPPGKGVRPKARLDYLGWHKQTQDNLHYVGIWLENGRIRDYPDGRAIKTGLQTIVDRFRPHVRMTPDHGIVLANFQDGDVDAVDAMLKDYGIAPGNEVSRLRRTEMACPALPLCPRAVAEAERVLPDIMRALEQGGHGDADVVIRMSGCSNNCSRARTAEIGILGSGRERYDIYLGGNDVGTRLNELLVKDVKISQLVKVISTFLMAWKTSRQANERFGDWYLRQGRDTLGCLLGAQAAEAARSGS